MRKRVLYFLCAMLCLAILSGSCAYAKTNMSEIPDEYKNDIKNNYWGEYTYIKGATAGYDGVIPVYLKDYFSGSKLKWAYYPYSQYFICYPHLGFFTSEESQQNFNFFAEAWCTYANPTKPHKEPKDPKFNHWQGGKEWIPYGWNAHEALFDKVPEDYNIRGDIKEKGLSSTKVAEHTAGDSIDLELSLDLNWFKKAINTDLTSAIGSEFPAYYTMLNNLPETALTQYDSELVYVLDLPEGLETTQATRYSLSGVSGFNITAARQGRRLIIKARIEQPKNYIMLKKMYEQIQKLSTITLNIEGLKISESIKPNENKTLTAYSYGVFETIITSCNKTITDQNQVITPKSEADRHSFWRDVIMFAARQSKDGIDEAGPKDKPELLTYTFTAKAKEISGGTAGTATPAVISSYPRTGENENIVVYAVMLGFSLIAMLALFIRKSRKQN